MSIKTICKKVLKKLQLTEKTKLIISRIQKRIRITKRYTFENRMKNKDKVCIILAGYKEFLWDIVFKRIKTFIPDDIEVCILSSGKYSEKLSEIAKKNNWSYLSTKRNNVSLIQNIAINLFEKAEYIYKLDEDIFVTRGYFETLMETLKVFKEKGEYRLGFIAPTIPINGFGYLNILKRFNLVDEYTKMFEKPIYILDSTRMLENSLEVAEFFWGKDGYLPSIDKMNDIVQHDEFKYLICPIRFSIGAILFTRQLWDEMDYFKVTSETSMGIDEKQICEYCMNKSKAIVVSQNTIVGHLSFGKQNIAMKEYFKNNKEKFDIQLEESENSEKKHN